jgi:DNA (cytosine-5)-methyltransferase 1
MTNNVISLFSGGGGLDMGFKKAGYNIIWAIDNDNNAVMTYKKNIGSHIICDDINTIDAKTIPNAQVLIGGPPCQSFSLSGKRDVEDARGQLVWRYIHIIEQIKPEAFVFENVTGLLSAKNKQNEKKDPLSESYCIKSSEIFFLICAFYRETHIYQFQNLNHLVVNQAWHLP